ncbi:UvrD-helicase domain-containing protein [Paenibacillus elgii]|uniref:UvrD-helicase domain-containing protein n=1 Tax=Paenibacillus elgii TaxID=189691 RepID=UPI002D7A4E5E|nr:UvrD-helicase domain-containing protein [Paenibacillus elgii]
MLNWETVRQGDEDARKKILHELGVSFLVEAGAGTGKTTSLVGRMVNVIKRGEATIREIAAITFTNKAASELSCRFRLKLEEELQEATEGCPERERLELAVQQFGRGFIGTIHGFCARLLRERPIESGLDPAFREIDESESKEFRDRSWDEYLGRLRDEGRDVVLQGLFELDVQLEELCAVYHRVSQYEDVVIFTQDTDRPDFDTIRLSLPDMVRDAVRFIPDVPPEKGWDALQEAVRHALRLLQNMDLGDDQVVLDLVKLFDCTLDVTQNRWTDKSEAKRLKEEFLEWQQTVLEPFLEAWREYLHPKLIRFVLPAVQYARLKRIEAGVLDFQDLLLKAAELLREYRDVRAYFGRCYTRLFVDEFQDTDPIQTEMMLLLTGALPKEDNWRRQVPRPGSLFVVGDPMQSIYRFRRADISTYNFVKDRIAAHGEVLQLTQNFRSVPSIGDYVNNAFETMFAPTKTDQQVEYTAMLTSRSNPNDKCTTHGVKVLTVPKQERDRKAAIAEYDAERIAQWIAWACSGRLHVQEQASGGKTGDRPAEPGDFMILLKQREFISLYAAKLESYGIPSDTTGDRAGGEELDALQTLAEFLGDYTDAVRLLAVLRGPLFGLSDEALFYYAMEVGRVSLFTGTDDGRLASSKAKLVGDALRMLRSFWDVVRTMPASVAFVRIVDDLGLIPYTAVRETGAIRSGTLIKLAELIQQELPSSTSWFELIAYLRRLREAEVIEGTTLFAGSGKAVRIMNLHKAKGLEAPVVFLACPCGHKEIEALEHIDRSTEPALGYFAIRQAKGTYAKEVVAQPPDWKGKAEKERIYQQAEEERLQYVAATRAKQLLIVSLYPAKPAIDPWSKLAVSLRRQPELEEVSVERSVSKPLVEVPDIATVLEPWRRWLVMAEKPTYIRTSVTLITKNVGDAGLFRPSRGLGKAFGSVVHRCINAIGGGLQPGRLETFLQLAVEEEGLDSKWLPDIMSSVRRVLESGLWRRSQKAKQVYHEFSFMSTSEETLGSSLCLLKGAIDLVFEEEDGWVIVDFKTDMFEAKHLDRFVHYYAPQVRAYTEQWTRVFQLPVKETGIYFTFSESYVRV